MQLHLEHVEDNDNGDVDCLELVASIGHPKSQPGAHHSCGHGNPSDGGADNISQQETGLQHLGLQADSGSCIVLEHLQPVGVGLIAVGGVRSQYALSIATSPAHHNNISKYYQRTGKEYAEVLQNLTVHMHSENVARLSE